MIRKGKLYYESFDIADNYDAQLANNPKTGEWTIDVSCPTEKYTAKGESGSETNRLILRCNTSKFILYKVEDDLYYGEWIYRDSNSSEISFVKLELDD